MSKYDFNSQSKISRVALYARVSTNRQTSKDSSLKFQIDGMTEYAEKHGYEVVHVFKDEGISGQTDNRPEFQEMMTMAGESNKPFDAVLVWKFDRFSRNQKDSIIYKDILRNKCKVDLISINESCEDQIMDSFQEKLRVIMDEFFSESLSRNISRGIRFAKERKLTEIAKQLKENEVGK